VSENVPPGDFKIIFKHGVDICRSCLGSHRIYNKNDLSSTIVHNRLTNDSSAMNKLAGVFFSMQASSGEEEKVIGFAEGFRKQLNFHGYTLREAHPRESGDLPLF